MSETVAMVWVGHSESGPEDAVVRYYRNPDDSSLRECGDCGNFMHDHGWIDEDERGRVVCPGDVVLTLDGRHFPLKPELFALFRDASLPGESIRDPDVQKAMRDALHDLVSSENLICKDIPNGPEWPLKHKSIRLLLELVNRSVVPVDTLSSPEKQD